MEFVFSLIALCWLWLSGVSWPLIKKRMSILMWPHDWVKLITLHHTIITVTFQLVLNIQSNVQRVERQHRIVNQTKNGLCCHLWRHSQRRWVQLDFCGSCQTNAMSEWCFLNEIRRKRKKKKNISCFHKNSFRQVQSWVPVKWPVRPPFNLFFLWMLWFVIRCFYVSSSRMLCFLCWHHSFTLILNFIYSPSLVFFFCLFV